MIMSSPPQLYANAVEFASAGALYGGPGVNVAISGETIFKSNTAVSSNGGEDVRQNVWCTLAFDGVVHGALWLSTGTPLHAN